MGEHQRPSRLNTSRRTRWAPATEEAALDGIKFCNYPWFNSPRMNQGGGIETAGSLLPHEERLAQSWRP